LIVSQHYISCLGRGFVPFSAGFVPFSRVGACRGVWIAMRPYVS